MYCTVLYCIPGAEDEENRMAGWQDGRMAMLVLVLVLAGLRRAEGEGTDSSILDIPIYTEIGI